MEIIFFIKTAIPLPISFLFGIAGGLFTAYSLTLLLNEKTKKKSLIYQIIGGLSFIGFMPFMVSFLIA